MKRGEHVIVFADLLGFAKLTELWPRRIVHRRFGQFRSSGTSEAHNQLVTFHSVLEQTIQEFTRQTGGIAAMSFSDCAFVRVGNPLLSASFAVALMQHFVRAGVPVRMGVAAGTFWPARVSTDIVGTSTFSRAIFHGTAIVRAHQAESCGLAGMRIFLHESMQSVFSAIDYRFRVMKFERKRKAVVGELSYLYTEEAYTAVNHPDPEEDNQILWKMTTIMRRDIARKAPRRVHQQYVQTLAALNRMRTSSAQPRFKR